MLIVYALLIAYSCVWVPFSVTHNGRTIYLGYGFVWSGPAMPPTDRWAVVSQRLASQAEQSCRASDPARAGSLVALLAAQILALSRHADEFIVEDDHDPASAAMPLDGELDPRELAALVDQLRSSDLSAMQRFAELEVDADDRNAVSFAGLTCDPASLEPVREVAEAGEAV